MKENPEVSESIEMLARHCTDNIDWYVAYMRGNSPRIVGDADFVSRHIARPAKVLDIGAVPPLFIELLRRRGYGLCCAVDPHPEPFSAYFRTQGVAAVKGDLLNQRLPELAESFDLVCLNEVIEHIAGNLLVAIQNGVDCIKPGGYLMVTTPNLRSVWGVAALLWRSSGLASKPGHSVRDQFDRASSQFGYFGHIREYTKHEVVELIESFGLELRACEFQKNYNYSGRITKLVGIAETFLPNWRLFGKYLFKKPAYMPTTASPPSSNHTSFNFERWYGSGWAHFDALHC